MAARAMAPSSTHESQVAATATGYHIPKEMQPKLAIKVKCKNCDKQFQKFTLRKGRAGKGPSLKEFSLCIDCWRASVKQADAQHKHTTSALFDVIGGISDAPRRTGGHLAAVKSRKHYHVTLDHHIFNDTYGWIVKESNAQPTIRLTLSTNRADYDHLILSCPAISPQKVTAITDTGAQSSLMGLKAFLACGFHQKSLFPVKRQMYTANNEGINILGAIFVRLSGADQKGKQIQAAEMIYVTDSTDLFYLSRHALEQLQIIGSDFPKIGAATEAVAVNTAALPSNERSSCGCLTRQPPPHRPDTLPFAPIEENE